jgi:SAM-dependent methyltransferase
MNGFNVLKDPPRLLNGLRRVLEAEGASGVVRAISGRLHAPRASSFGLCHGLKGKIGFEIGGPSAIFKKEGLLPIYPIAGRLDNCNFSSTTVWEGSIREGRHFRFNNLRPPGFQHLREAVDLREIPSNSYDFVLSSHTLEHTANPLRVLLEWKRLLKSGGIMVLVLPHRDGTFDHRRPVTPLAHLIEDFEHNTSEDDLTHLPEILRLHDLERDPLAGNFEEFRKRSLDNFANRCLHHHVFDTRLAIAVTDHVGLQICGAEALLPFHIVVVCQKMASGHALDNRPFMCNGAAFRHRSPFSSDRA